MQQKGSDMIFRSREDVPWIDPLLRLPRAVTLSPSSGLPCIPLQSSSSFVLVDIGQASLEGNRTEGRVIKLKCFHSFLVLM